MDIALKYLNSINKKINKNERNIDKFKIFNDAFLINLDNRIDRLKHSIMQTSKVDIKFNRFKALSFTDKGKYWSTGVRGCAESHIKIMKENIDNKFPILIMEDDLVFTNNFNKFIEFIKILPPKWDLLFFHNNSGNSLKIEWHDKPVLDTQFYIANNQSLQKIIELSNKNCDPIDRFFVRSNQIKKYCTSINLVIQSTNLGTNIKENERYLARRSKRNRGL